MRTVFYHGHVMKALSREAEVVHVDAPPPANDVGEIATQMPLMVLPEQALRAVKRRGHMGRPGDGPKGETCGSCEHRVRVDGGNKAFSKCNLNRANWTRGSASDIRKKDPACQFWTAWVQS